MRRFNLLKWGAYALVILAAAILQAQAAFYPRFMDVTPLFILPAVISISIFEGETVGGIYGIAAGLLWDCGTGRVFGFNAFFIMIVAIAVGLLFRHLFKNSPLSALLFTALATVLHELVTWFFFYFMTDIRDIVFALLHIVLPTVLLTLIFTIPIYYGIRFLNRRLTDTDNSDLSV